MELVLKRLATLEATVATLTQHNEDLTHEVLSLRGQNVQLQQHQHAMGTDLNGRWVALSSQLQFFMQQQYQPQEVAPVGARSAAHHCAVNIPPSATPKEHPQAPPLQVQGEYPGGVTPPRISTAGSTHNAARRLDMSADSVGVPPSPPMTLHMAGVAEPEQIIHH